MSAKKKEYFGDLLASLQERAKELNCLYAVEEILNEPDIEPEEVCRGILRAIPPGWQYPAICQARITVNDLVFETDAYRETPWAQTAEVQVQDETVGSVLVSYTREMPTEDDGPFLAEEKRLIRTIADRLGHYFHYCAIKQHFHDMESAREDLGTERGGSWRVILDLLAHTDQHLYLKISHKMLNHLCWSGVPEAEKLIEEFDPLSSSDRDELHHDANQALERRDPVLPERVGRRIFRIACEHLSDDGILFRIQKWMQEDKLGFLVRAVERNLALPEVADAIRRYHHVSKHEAEVSESLRAGVRVSLIRRFLSDQLAYIKVAKEHVRINDFHELLKRMIFASDSQGRLGGKTAGLYLANQILANASAEDPILAEVRTPKTWHVTSDMQLDFMHYNNLDEIVEQKYKEMGQVRFEYPHIVHTCKNARFPAELEQGLSVALDDLSDKPLIVRSSSVLEDRVGAAFSGKYKSLFLANQGTKRERLEALKDAVAEVYASMFGPDPIEYRRERGLTDFAEEMGIMIQEVVGTRVGRYFLPLFAGVAFSRNEFRWSPRIRREDGLIRLVPGLGTRAVDRLGDDYPIMFAPGQPGLRVNVSVDETLRYSPRSLDAIDLESHSFVTLDAVELLREHGEDLPGLEKILSIHEAGHFRRLSLAETDLTGKDLVITFEGLMSDRYFVAQMQSILRVLEEKFGTPVDIEFAHDGTDLHLLQCRAQVYSEESSPAPIPKDVPPEDLVFSASKFVSNGSVPDITHIVYVDHEAYGALPDRAALLSVGRAVSSLNKMLPKRQFVLMGPGRWGSRGDVKLGVSVTYSDINNTAMLIEVARQKGRYTPDLSFGTHFFQDLVEAGIRYLPLYPDEPGNVFQERFLRRAPSVLKELLPEFEHLEETLRVIDVAKVKEGRVLRILMNADLDEAVAMLCDPASPPPAGPAATRATDEPAGDHWRWRHLMAERLARRIDADRFGVVGAYLFGSTKNCTAGPGSDIDLLVHFRGDEEQRNLLLHWLEGWSATLAEMNYLKTGYRSDGLLDVHLVTDEDLEKRTSYAVKIGAVTDAARPLLLGDEADALAQ